MLTEMENGKRVCSVCTTFVTCPSWGKEKGEREKKIFIFVVCVHRPTKKNLRENEREGRVFLVGYVCFQPP